MTTILSILGSLTVALLLAMAFSPYLCRLAAWLLMAYANAVQTGKEMFRAEMDRLHGPVVGRTERAAAKEAE